MSDVTARQITLTSPRVKSWLKRLPVLEPRFLSGLIFAVLAVLTAYTFTDYGVSWDEQVQDIYGHDLLHFYLTSFRDQSAFHYLNLRYYGGAFDLVAAGLNAVSPFGEYETRHLLGGIVGLVGFFGAWRLTGLLAGQRAAFIALLLLALTPLLYGHNFINPKDAPFAWALVWSMYYACRAIMELPKPSRGAAIGLGVALGLALGTRVVGVIALVYCAPSFLAYAGGRYLALRDRKLLGRELTTFLVALWPAIPVAFVLTALFWPWVVQSPDNLDTALTLFSHFPWKGEVLFNGHTYSSTDLPGLYLPLLLALQLPEPVLAGVVVACVSGLRAARRLGLGLLSDRRALCYGVLLAAIIVPLLDFLLLRPAIYNGIRHFLFVVPPLVILGAIGIDRLYAWAKARARVLAYALILLMAAFTARQTVLMADLHPDEYISFNALAGGVSGASERFDLDYWGLSLAEAARDLAVYVRDEKPRDSAQTIWVYVCGDWLSAAYFFPPGSNLHYTGAQSAADFAIAIREPTCTAQVRGRRILEVKRGGSVLSYATDLRGLSPAERGQAHEPQ